MMRRICKSIDDLPICLKVEDLAAVLNISRQKAYELVKTKDFPRITLGKRIVIPKSALFHWLDSELNDG